jgi:hypothetical protein
MQVIAQADSLVSTIEALQHDLNVHRRQLRVKCSINQLRRLVNCFSGVERKLADACAEVTV